MIETFLTWAWVPSLVLTVVLIGVAVAVAVAFPRSAPGAGESAPVEPVLPRPVLPVCHSLPHIVSIHGLEPGAGCTTLAFNIGVEVATAGTIEGRRPRVACVLRAGPLTASVGLVPEPLTAYLRTHVVSVDDEVIDLAVRHPSGCEVLCLADGVLEGTRLGRLMEVLRRHYDAILVDCPLGDRWLRDKAFDLAEVNLLVARSSDESVEAMVPWFEMAWELRLVGRLALVVSRVTVARPIPEVLLQAFPNHAAVPEDHSPGRPLELPWVLRFESGAGRAIGELAERLMPMLMGREASRAA